MEKILKRLLNAPWIVIAVTFAISVFLFMEMKQNTKMETDLDKYMPQDHPAFVYSDQAEEWFGINDEIRTGVNAVKFDYYLGNNTFEVIWLPNFEPTEKPGAGSIWYTQPEFLITPVFDWSGSEVKPSLENSEMFLKYSALTSKIDFELMGGYTWAGYPWAVVRSASKLKEWFYVVKLHITTANIFRPKMRLLQVL
ncbi:hypothetical protein ES705_13125 [subsurface metagenome]